MDKGSISHMDTLSAWHGDAVAYLNFVTHPYSLYITLGHSGPNKYGYSVDKKHGYNLEMTWGQRSILKHLIHDK